MRSILVYSFVILSGLILPSKSFSDEVPSLEFLEFLAMEEADGELLESNELKVVSSGQQQNDGDDESSGQE